LKSKTKTKFDQQSKEKQQDSSEESQQDSKETTPPILNKAKKPAGVEKNLVKKFRNATLSQIKYFKAMTSLLLHRINKSGDQQQKIVAADDNVAEQPPQIQPQQNTTTKQYPVQIDSVNCGKKSCTSSELSDKNSAFDVEKQSGEFVKTNENILPVFFKPKMVPQKRKLTHIKEGLPKDLFILLGVPRSTFSRLHFSDLFNYALDLFSQSLDYYGYERAAFLTYGGPSYYYVPLTKKSEFSVNRTLSGYRNLTTALNFILQTMEPISDQRRQLVTILPDRIKNENEGGALESVKHKLKTHGFEMYCLGVGKSFDKDKTSIKKLASKPIHDHTIKASYSSLNKTMPLLFKKLSLAKGGEGLKKLRHP